ncbi:MAG: pyridoxal-phosphate dependent enzyme [Rickettsiales bacterium]|nr:pyridoxal-phosphate dependent enzyme [Rickettsiales bacterium]
MKDLNFLDIIAASKRIKNYIKKTPIISNQRINDELGAQIFFKMDNLQETNSFKARGAFNAILNYQEIHGHFPKKIVVQSSGNHAQAIAYACKKFGIEALIYMIDKASPVKIAAAKNLGAKVILFEKRSQVNAAAEAKQAEGYFFIHPSANAEVICGQGTAALEALQETGEVEAIFAPCGGGGLISGCFIAAQKLSPQAKIFACEPLNANDVAQSFRQNKIIGFEQTPNTIADGARTLATSEICFHFIKQLTGVLEISESEIILWQKKLSETLQQNIEPTSALAIAGAAQFIKNNYNSDSSAKNHKLLVIISGGNCESLEN